MQVHQEIAIATASIHKEIRNNNLNNTVDNDINVVATEKMTDMSALDDDLLREDDDLLEDEELEFQDALSGARGEQPEGAEVDERNEGNRTSAVGSDCGTVSAAAVGGAMGGEQIPASEGGLQAMAAAAEMTPDMNSVPTVPNIWMEQISRSVSQQMGQMGQQMAQTMAQQLAQQMARFGVQSNNVPPRSSNKTRKESRLRDGSASRPRTDGSASRPRTDAAFGRMDSAISNVSDQDMAPKTESEKNRIVDEAWERAMQPRDVAPRVRDVIEFNKFGMFRSEDPEAEKIRCGCRQRANVAITQVLVEVVQKCFGWKRGYDSQPVATVKDIQETVQTDSSKADKFRWAVSSVFDTMRTKCHRRLAHLFQLESGIIVAPESADPKDPQFRKLRTMEDVHRAESATRSCCMANAISRKLTERKSTIADSAFLKYGYKMKTNQPRPADDETGKRKRNRYVRSSRDTYFEPIKSDDKVIKNLQLQNQKLQRLIRKVSE